MRYRSILGLSSVAIVTMLLFMTACDKVNIPGGGVTDVMKNLPVADNIPVSVPPVVVAGVGKAAYLLEVGQQTVERDQKVTDRMDAIFQRLKVAALADEKYRVVATELEKEWKLNTLRVQKPSTPAAAFPGGGIALYTGYFRTIQFEGVLAAILGHEMAHLLSQHHLQRWNSGAAAGLIAIGSAIASGESLDKMDPEVIGPVLGAMGIGYIVGKDLPLERGKELEADCSGLVLAAKAGYDPAETKDFWQDQDNKAKNKNSNDTFQLFKIHPPAKDRHSHISTTCLSAAQAAFNQVEAGKRQKTEVRLPEVEV